MFWSLVVLQRCTNTRSLLFHQHVLVTLQLIHKIQYCMYAEHTLAAVESRTAALDDRLFCMVT